MAQQEQPRRVDTAALKQRIGRVGVWSFALSDESASFERSAAAELEDLGYGAVWLGEAPWTKEALTHSAILLSGSRRLVVATGIANIWARDATAAANGANTLAEASGGRFLLGLGVSHRPLVQPRGEEYGGPLSRMRAYLDAMDRVEYHAPLPEAPPRMLAALRGRMLELSAERTHGAHSYFVPPEHTARARAVLGPDPVLAPEQALVLDVDAARARRAARAYMAFYLALPNYLNNLRELGWSDEDFADGGSDALVDAIVVWGTPETIAERVRAHHDAGADHVCVQPVTDTAGEQLEHLRILAPALTGQ
ncbi:TIGR03620 family F420-dependent LLM class oxidoreductase [Planosporangium flavigriseum]|uniref:LLM class F420-dependent oxidoreductase n=1 Tax=Planosporangium flavigriseum TaxID=373681 RepID=A0A8J3LLI9_9ACTN|nr:TIGR03620 family F420-dependent LLM class oxidoreductase [Planosporangium flavigriseum]NJC65680.1 TIGR03620 family F420-dependent LLM class oxidoreductase [Planosporangium flavigriseum]GIG73529.1 LLM class F420-dependent oxidoreductase [Planosporangium flavigriseum]